MADDASTTMGAKEYTVKRGTGWSSDPCFGHSALYADGHPGNGALTSLPYEVLGRELPHGTRIRVTVEVLTEGRWPTKCTKTWHHSHKQHTRPVDVPFGYAEYPR